MRCNQWHRFPMPPLILCQFELELRPNPAFAPVIGGVVAIVSTSDFT